MAAAAQQSGWQDPLGDQQEIVDISQPPKIEPRSAPRRSGLRELAEAYAQLASAALKTARRAMSRSWNRASERTAQEAGLVVTRAKARLDYARREQPIQLLTVLACVGILGGMALRIWRNRS